MGGVGSGNYYRSKKTNTDNASPLSISRMIKQGAIEQGCMKSGVWQWTCNGEVYSSVSYRSNMLDIDNAYLELSYTTKAWGEKEDINYKIPIVYTRPNFGGYRFWFKCPFQHIRASVLYSPYGGKYYASRKAYNLKYASQSESETDRAIARMWKAKEKLVHEYGRPKGMHEKTYERLLDDVYRAEDACNQIALSRFGMRIF